MSTRRHPRATGAGSHYAIVYLPAVRQWLVAAVSKEGETNGELSVRGARSLKLDFPRIAHGPIRVITRNTYYGNDKTSVYRKTKESEVVRLRDYLAGKPVATAQPKAPKPKSRTEKPLKSNNRRQ